MKSPSFSGKLKNNQTRVKLPIVVRKVQGSSMLPSYTPGSVIVGIKPWRALAIGDVIVFWHNDIEKIKRVSSLHKKGLYVLGDNASSSTDSRTFGLIAYSSVTAIVLWPKK